MNTQKEVFEIEGTGGVKKLEGKIGVKGAKNAALKAMAASILFDGPIILDNVPINADVINMAEILRELGAKVSINNNELEIDCLNVSHTNITEERARTMRSSVVLTGPLLARFSKTTFSSPGGCVIGTRPIDLFFSSYEAMGAKVEYVNDKFEISSNGTLKGTEIFFDIQSVGGTETIMMAAVLAKGTTVLRNCAMEPEIVSVAEWLNECGAQISGAGTPTIVIEGRSGKLLSPKNKYTAIPDRIEAGSYLILAVLAGKDVTITDCEPLHMEALTSKLLKCGANLEIGKNYIRIKESTTKLKAFDIRTHEYPGFPTDLQSQIVSLLVNVKGESKVFETIFEDRFAFVDDLQRMGAEIEELSLREVLIKGPSELHELSEGEMMLARDIRAGFAILIATIFAKGKFTIGNIHLIDRGYEKIEERLSLIGVKIIRKIL